MRNRFSVCAILAIALGLGIASTPGAQAEDSPGPDIVNLAHLDFLHATAVCP